MKTPYVSELAPNQLVTGVFLVQQKEIRQKKTGEPYLSLTLADRTAATRELGQLADLGLLERIGQGRGAAYTVPLDRFRPDTLEDGLKD